MMIRTGKLYCVTEYHTNEGDKATYANLLSLDNFTYDDVEYGLSWLVVCAKDETEAINLFREYKESELVIYSPQILTSY